MLNTFLAFDKNPQVIELAQTPLGKLALIIAFCALLSLSPFHSWPIVSAALLLLTFLPQYKNVILIISAICAMPLLSYLPWSPTAHSDYVTQMLCILLTYVIALGYIALIKNPESLLGKKPLLYWLVLYFALLVLGHHFVNINQWHYYLWSFIIAFGNLFWFVAYSFKDRKKLTNKNLIKQIAFYIPFWGSPATPIGKGSAYLNAVYVKDDTKKAQLMLNALKLLIWAFILNIILNIELNIAKHFGVPSFSECMRHFHLYQHISPEKAWAIWLIGFSSQMLWLCFFGHTFVAIARMAGFKILRNTYRPLSSQTIAEFWARYFYYFKELLAEFFFYPCYFKYFKNKAKLRLFFATFMAVCVGNTLFHLLEHRQLILHHGFLATLKAFSVYGIYSLVLAFAIFLSTLRNQKPHFKLPSIFRSIIVIAFYALMFIFSYAFVTSDITTNLHFLKLLM